MHAQGMSSCCSKWQQSMDDTLDAPLRSQRAPTWRSSGSRGRGRRQKAPVRPKWPVPQRIRLWRWRGAAATTEPSSGQCVLFSATKVSQRDCSFMRLIWYGVGHFGAPYGAAITSCHMRPEIAFHKPLGHGKVGGRAAGLDPMGLQLACL